MQQQTLLFTDDPDSDFDHLDPAQQHRLLTLMASLIVDIYNAEIQDQQEENSDE